MRKKTDDEKFDLGKGFAIAILALIALCVGAVKVGYEWQRVSNEEASYQKLGWKTVDSRIVQLKEVNGNFKPVSQTAVLEYHYNSELPIQTQQQIALGYHEGDKVDIYTNSEGKVQVVGAPDPNRPSHYLADPTYRDFFFDYAGSIVNGVFTGIFVAGGVLVGSVVVIMIFVCIAICFESIFSKNKKQTKSAS
jgi:hypothetical protein